MEQKAEGADALPRENEESRSAPPSSVVVTRPTWVTWVAVFACVSIFIGVNLQEDKYSRDVLARFGFFTGEQIWRGTWWGTASSTFVHISPIHAFFNLYWLWLLGRLMEEGLGSWRFLLFYLGAALISSTSQLAFSDSSGIGASGVLYAVFGFMWRTRTIYPKFRSIMVPQTIKIFFIWLVVCFFLTAANIMKIANAAHLSGLVYGVVVADCFVIRRPRLPYVIGALALAAVSLVPLRWAPRSTAWQAVKAEEAMKAGRTREAIERLTFLIDRDPEDAWAYGNRGLQYRALGETEKATADLERAVKLRTATVTSSK